MTLSQNIMLYITVEVQELEFQYNHRDGLTLNFDDIGSLFLEIHVIFLMVKVLS